VVVTADEIDELADEADAAVPVAAHPETETVAGLVVEIEEPFALVTAERRSRNHAEHTEAHTMIGRARARTLRREINAGPARNDRRIQGAFGVAETGADLGREVDIDAAGERVRKSSLLRLSESRACADEQNRDCGQKDHKARTYGTMEHIHSST